MLCRLAGPSPKRRRHAKRGRFREAHDTAKGYFNLSLASIITLVIFSFALQHPREMLRTPSRPRLTWLYARP